MTNKNIKATKDQIIELVKEIRQERYQTEANESGAEVKKVTSKKELKAEIEDVVLAYKELLLDGQDVPFGEIGTFKNKVRAARKGRNPQTGKEIDIAETKAIGFTPSKNIKDELKSLS